MEDKTPKELTQKELDKLNDELAKDVQTDVNTEDFSIGGEHIGYAENANDKA